MSRATTVERTEWRTVEAVEFSGSTYILQEKIDVMFARVGRDKSISLTTCPTGETRLKAISSDDIVR